MHVGGVPDILPHIFSLNGVPVAKIAEGEQIAFSIRASDADEFRRSEAAKRNSENGMNGTAVKAMMAEIAPVIREFVASETGPLIKRIAELEARPAPEVDSVFILQLVQDEIAKIPPAENGKDADPEQVASLVAETVERAVAALPVPQDGKSVAVEDVSPLIAEEVAKVAPDMAAINEAIVEQVSKAVAEIPVPKDGEPGKDAAGVVEALKDSGELVLTLADGRLVRTGIRDGENGKPGRDGFALEDFDVERGDDGRTYILKFERDDVRHEYELTFPVPVYCGIYKADDEYAPGDLVTWGGSMWHCDEPTKEKPGAGPWTLAAKKGRDGRDAKPNG